MGARLSRLSSSRRHVFAWMLAVAGLLSGAGLAHGFSWDAAKDRQTLQLLRQFQVQHRVPSVALSVTVDGKVVLARSFNVNGSIVPGGEDVRYRIGSVTKQFTAAAILALIEDKAIVPATHAPLTFDTTLGEIFPHDVDRTSDVGKITVWRLLTMTSNLPSYTNDPAELQPDATGVAPAFRAIGALDLVRLLKSYSLTGAPQTFEYSNTNYFVLALVIHILNGGTRQPSDLPVWNYVHRRILERAGMTNTGFVGEPAPPGAVDASPNFLYSPRFNQGAWPKGAGDMISTAADMARWNIALVTGKVIDESLLQKSLAPLAPVTGSELYRGCLYAPGWYVCERPGYRLYQHDGVISGFMASNAIARQADGSWMSATVLGDIDATTDIVALLRSIVQLGY